VLGYDNSFAVGSNGHSGGIIMFWNNKIKMEILPYLHLDAIVTEGEADPWRLTCVYRKAKTAERSKTWDMLKYIRASLDLPWMCIETSMRFYINTNMKV
jgi:hypothetical protein